MISEQELFKQIINVVNNYDEIFTDEDLDVLDGINKIFNDAEFERKHPRDKDGKFARTNSEGNSDESNVKKLHIPSPEYKAILESIKESNKQEITPADIIESAVKNLNLNAEEVRQKIAEAEEYFYTWDLDTKDRFSQDGVYTEERQKLHDKILSNIFKNSESAKPPKGEKPTAIFLGGRGGSGKSKFDMPNEKRPSNLGIYDRSKYIVLDADEIKKELKPEYKYDNASEVHEESSDILNMALGIARERGLNVVLDATMKSLGSTEKKIKSFADADYNIEMYYMHLPRIKAAERAIKRFTADKQGRYVPLEQLLKMKDNEENFDKLKHYASKWAFYNNDVPSEADKPILIDKNY